MSALLLAATLLQPPPAAPGPAGVFASCAWVRAENDGSGTGFVVDAGRRWLVTCRHVVADREKVGVFFPWQRDGALVTDRRDYLGNRPLLRDRGLFVTGKVLKRHDAADLALVELDSLPPAVKAIPFAAAPARPGDPLLVVGNRLDLDTLWTATTGPVRQVGRLADGYHWRGKTLAVNAAVVIGQLPTEEGDSGGPVVNALGELVGMASALRRQAPTAAVVISAAEVRAFLALAEPKPQPQPAGIADALTRATVWVRPTATDFHTAGVLIDRNLILTSAKGSGTLDRVGVAFPVRDGDRWVGEREPYRDPVGLYLKGAWRAGTVVARDPARDLAVIRVDSVPDYMKPVPLAEKAPAPGDAVHAMNHPGGLEFAWVYATGTVRQLGWVALADGDQAARVPVTVLQLPAQAGSPGGPVLNARGKLIGVLSSRESAQQTGYAATPAEIARFLDVALVERPARTVEGLLARAQSLSRRLTVALAEACALRALDHRRGGRLHEAARDCRTALALDPGCAPARLCLVGVLTETGMADEARAVLDFAADRGPLNDRVLLARAGVAMDRKEWRAARGDLERILDVNPADAVARRRLVGALLELGKDGEAATAVRDTLRADPAQLPQLAADLLKQADELEKKFAEGVPAAWLARALGSAQAVLTDPVLKAKIEAALKRATGAKGDAERLALLRSFTTTLAGK